MPTTGERGAETVGRSDQAGASGERGRATAAQDGGTHEDAARLITRSAGKMGIATSASRVLGLLRDTTFAALFGTSAVADAFNVAFLIPNFFRRLLGEGLMSAAFVPVYSEHLEKRPREQVNRLANAALGDLALGLGIVTIVGMIVTGALVAIYAPGWRGRPEQVDLTVRLTRLLFPYVLFVGMAALVQAILHASYRFTIPALSPVVLNLCFIAGALFLCPRFGPRLEDQVFGFAIGGLVGGLGQLLIQLPVLRQTGFRWKPRVDFRSPEIREVLGLMVPGLFGLAVSQINMLVDSFLATFLASGSVTALRLGSRVSLLPLGIFGVAIAAAALPVLSHRAARGEPAALREILSHSTRMILFLLLPATVGLVVLREPIVRLLFVRGAFDAGESLRVTSEVLAFYALGLSAYGGVKVVAQVFYSLKDTATPVRVAALSVVANVVLNLLLMGPMGAGGLALATSIASAINMGVLLAILRKRIGRIGGAALLSSGLRMLAASLAMGAAAAVVYAALGPALPEGRLVPLAARLGAAIAAGLVTYFGLAAILRMDEFSHLASFFRGRSRAPSAP
jgi:putative peptidoglycan lipid II flippase